MSASAKKPRTRKEGLADRCPFRPDSASQAIFLALADGRPMDADAVTKAANAIRRKSRLKPVSVGTVKNMLGEFRDAVRCAPLSKAGCLITLQDGLYRLSRIPKNAAPKKDAPEPQNAAPRVVIIGPPPEKPAVVIISPPAPRRPKPDAAPDAAETVNDKLSRIRDSELLAALDALAVVPPGDSDWLVTGQVRMKDWVEALKKEAKDRMIDKPTYGVSRKTLDQLAKSLALPDRIRDEMAADNASAQAEAEDEDDDEEPAREAQQENAELVAVGGAAWTR